MRKEFSEPTEHLIRVRAIRRDAPVEIRVHYDVIRVSGCDIIRLFSVEDTD
jgi:hypothetical protein